MSKNGAIAVQTYYIKRFGKWVEVSKEQFEKFEKRQNKK